MYQPFWIYSHPHGVRCGGRGGHHMPFSFHGSWAMCLMVEMMPKTGSENLSPTTVRHIVSIFFLYIPPTRHVYQFMFCYKILMVVIISIHGSSMARQLPLHTKKFKNMYQACPIISTWYIHGLHLTYPPGLDQQRQHRWQQALDQETLSLPRTHECFQLIEQDPLLDYDLPRKSKMLAGQILKHCYNAIDRMLRLQYPCIWKVGYSHCAHFRFYNSKFGYQHEVEKWQKMFVIYAASETISPGFVEGAIIQRHKGFLNAHHLDIGIWDLLYIYIILSVPAQDSLDFATLVMGEKPSIPTSQGHTSFIWFTDLLNTHQNRVGTCGARYGNEKKR